MFIVYVDMDGVLVDFESGISKLTKDEQELFKGKYDLIPGIFSTMDPIYGAIDGIRTLCKIPDVEVYILSTAPWGNSSAWADKVDWIKKYIPEFEKRLILTHHKDLCRGNVLIDDRETNGANNFHGQLFKFHQKNNGWDNVLTFISDQILL